MTVPARVRMVEVGPRDGLQNEPAPLDVATRIELVERLAACGLREVEAGSFFSPAAVPQMADTDAVLAGLRRTPGVSYPVLVPNMRGLEAALAADADAVAVFAAASESFSQANLNRTIGESLDVYAEVAAAARRRGLRVRGYVSCALGCPYEGAVPVTRVVEVAAALDEMGCQEVSLGDTIGVGTPVAARKMVESVSARVPVARLAVHFHDTYGQALANVFACLEAGVGVVDSSVAGLGGCPFAPGAAGNVASEDVLFMLQGLGIETGVELDGLLEAGRFACAALGRRSASRVARALGGATGRPGARSAGEEPRTGSR